MRNFLLSLFVCFLFLGEAQAERLVLKYRVSWLGVTAGKIKLVVEEEGGLTKLYAQAKTTGMVKLFFPFKSKWTTWLDQNGYPVRSKIWRKKRGKEVLKEYFFDQRRGVVVRRKKGRESTYRLEHYPVHDELSAFYATMRARFKEPGEEKVLWVFAHKKANKSTVRYLEDEKLDTPCGPWWAKKLEVEFGFESELIKRSKRAYLWQAKGLILKSQGELAIGHVTGKLLNLDCKEERP